MKSGIYRSKFERRIAAFLRTQGMAFEYEAEAWEYAVPCRGGECSECGSLKVAKWGWYTPDFFLANGVVIEGKGKLDGPGRTKLVAVKAAHPDADLRLLFMRDNRIAKGSRTWYSDWAMEKGFEFHISERGEVPETWLRK